MKVNSEPKACNGEAPCLEGAGAILLRGSSVAFIIKILSAGLLLGMQVALARTMSREDYGFFQFAMVLLNILTLRCVIGLQGFLVRFVGEYRVNGQWALLKGIIRRFSFITGTASIFVALAGIMDHTPKQRAVESVRTPMPIKANFFPDTE